MNILNIALKLILFYMITSFIFGSVYAIYIVHIDKKMVIENDGVRKYTQNLLFVFIVCIVMSIIMTIKFFTNPLKFFKLIFDKFYL